MKFFFCSWTGFTFFYTKWLYYRQALSHKKAFGVRVPLIFCASQICAEHVSYQGISTYLKNQPKIKQFHLSQQCHSASADCARKLFNPQNTRQVFESVMKKQVSILGFGLFVNGVIKRGRFLVILAHVTWPWAQLLDRSILLSFHWKLG